MANTDGRVNKLVTVFADPAPQINPAESCTWIRAAVRYIKPAS
jgi:hypothetical protein